MKNIDEKVKWLADLRYEILAEINAMPPSNSMVYDCLNFRLAIAITQTIDVLGELAHWQHGTKA